jgi:hypothetical protein
MPGCGSLVPTETNLLDARLLPYEQMPCQAACGGVSIASSHTSGKACGGGENRVIPHILQKPVAGMDIESSHTWGESLWRGLTCRDPTLAISLPPGSAE